jgi:signal transduction histidine kinase
VAVAVENASLYEQAERSAALAERNRLARELHDSVTQSLYSITLYAEAASRSMHDGEVTEGTGYLHELRDTAQEALREMRLLIFELRPLALEKSGLAAALQTRLESVEERGGMHAHLRVEGAQYADRLPLAIQGELYHVAREALNNVLKHARAQHVEVHLQYGAPGGTASTASAVRLDICDDGVGFVPPGAYDGEGGGLGLRGMRERAQRIGGQLRIDSAPGQGTRVSIDVPQMYETAAPVNPPTV